MQLPTPERVKAVMRAKSYLVFGNQEKGYDLNLFGIRTADRTSNRFNDLIGVMYLHDDVWNCFMFPATTDPGLYWREHPMNVDGVAILKPGQYRGAYKVGEHKGYSALQQQKAMKVYRDSNKDKVLEMDESTVKEGIFGINIHRASSMSPSDNVDKWSAGCQVLQDPIQFEFLMDLARKASDIHGNSFTYTLLEEADFSKG